MPVHKCIYESLYMNHALLKVVVCNCQRGIKKVTLGRWLCWNHLSYKMPNL